jgi:N-acetylglucosamine kinase-like BadF-type ATPase
LLLALCHAAVFNQLNDCVEDALQAFGQSAQAAAKGDAAAAKLIRACCNKTEKLVHKVSKRTAACDCWWHNARTQQAS